MLLNHSRSMGVSVYERTKVNSISFSSDDPDTPISVSWTHTLPPCPISPPASPIESSFSPFLTGKSTSNITPDTVSISGETTFTHLIDATGRAGIMSSRYLKNRHFNASLKNVAIWGYWRNTGWYGAGTSRYGSPWFETLTGIWTQRRNLEPSFIFLSPLRCIRLGLVYPPS